MKKQNLITIDQISFMVPITSESMDNITPPDEVQAIKHLFRFDEVFDEPQELDYGFNGYTNALRYGAANAKILIMWSYKQAWLGVQVMFYGQGKKLYESLTRIKDIKADWHNLISYICLKFNGHVSRIDIAVDLINYGFSVNNISKKLNSGEYKFINGVTKRSINLDKIQTIGDSGCIDTIYVNSRKSDSFLRVYNKRKEGLNKNSGYYYMAKACKDWIRIEAEFKHRVAHKIGQEVAELFDSRKIYPYLADCITQHWILVLNDDQEKS